MHRSNANRVTLWLREYSNPLWTPGESWMKVELVKIGGITAPVDGSGCWPPWMQRVAMCASLGVLIHAMVVRASAREALRLPAAQPCDHVDLRDDAVEGGAVVHDGDAVRTEDRQQVLGPCRGMDRLEPR